MPTDETTSSSTATPTLEPPAPRADGPRRPFVPYFVLWYCYDVVRDILRRNDVPLAGKRVLEAGCGGGSMLFRLCDDVGHITGLDISKDAIAMLNEHYVPHHDNVEVVASDFADYQPDQPFDLVISNDCFEHVEDAEGFVRSAARCLAPDGVFCLQFPNFLDHGINHYPTLGDLRRRIEAHFGEAKYFEIIASGWHDGLHRAFSRLRARAQPGFDKQRRAVLADPRTQGLDDFARSACFTWMRAEREGSLKFKLARLVNTTFRGLERVGPAHRVVDLSGRGDEEGILRKRLVVVARGK